ncbi:DUF317 domain-containing protein [Streptomyces lancefieldiae]|uniref:DUF317 domain-containing protein n=1 Tax=Streptomyces lancefieldiae TaxID=3075520 RepID=A0ABU3AXV2_9ACTN|nr:DUF317 domain-containing protein [Streptomyces sp. DSM 40712]MDT0615008.1 DUF317 domain-containing protein [Streptomyces sp. DSM 40712]
MSYQSDPGHDIDGDVYVSPRYLAGLGDNIDSSFQPVDTWPHHRTDGECQLLIASPDHRIRIGWFGDYFDVWKISAAENAVAAPRWTVGISDKMPLEIVRDFIHALASEWDEDSESFLTDPSYRWSEAVQPLLDAGWERKPVTRGVIEIVSPDQLAGASIDVVSCDPDAEVVTLWAGRGRYPLRAEANFTARTPKRLIAAMAASFVAPDPILRYQADLSPELAQFAQLTPVEPPKPPAPTPLDVQQAAAARRPPALGTRSVPRWSTTTLPPAVAGAALPARRSGPLR